MKFKKEFILDGPVDMVWEAREKRFENPEKFPELQKHQELDRKESGNKLYVKNKMELASKVPGPLRKVFKDDMFDIIDESEYDLDTGDHKFKYTSDSTKIFKGVGKSKYTEFEKNGEKKTKRELQLEIKCNIPILGKLAEQFICDSLKKNIEKDNASIQKMLKMMHEEG